MQERRAKGMRTLLTVVTVMALLVAGAWATSADAQSACPPEVTKAKELLSSKMAVAKGKEVQAPRGQEVQAPRSLAGARSQEVQAPRGQEVQAPRGQEVQAPRGQEVQAPRGQEVQAPRGQEVQAPRGQEVQAPRGQEVQAPRSLAGAKQPANISKASTLVKQAEAACKAGDMKTAKSKAEAALAILK
jgi:hypothetical protein